MLAMQKPYGTFRHKGTDIHCSKGKTIEDFDQAGLEIAWEFDDRIGKYSKEEVDHTSGQSEGQSPVHSFKVIREGYVKSDTRIQ